MDRPVLRLVSELSPMGPWRDFWIILV